MKIVNKIQSLIETSYQAIKEYITPEIKTIVLTTSLLNTGKLFFFSEKASFMSYIIYGCLGIVGYFHGKDYEHTQKKQDKKTVVIRDLQDHDLYNIMILPYIIVTNIASLGQWIEYQTYQNAFMLYILIDTLYIWLLPSCVPNSKSVLGHHGLVMILLTHQYRWNEYLYMTPLISIVEVNTLLLITKRYLNIQNNTWIDNSYGISFVMIRGCLHPFCACKMLCTTFFIHSYIENAIIFISSGLLLVFNYTMFTKEKEKNKIIQYVFRKMFPDEPQSTKQFLVKMPHDQ